MHSGKVFGIFLFFFRSIRITPPPPSEPSGLFRFETEHFKWQYTSTFFQGNYSACTTSRCQFCRSIRQHFGIRKNVTIWIVIYSAHTKRGTHCKAFCVCVRKRVFKNLETFIFIIFRWKVVICTIVLDLIIDMAGCGTHTHTLRPITNTNSNRLEQNDNKHHQRPTATTTNYCHHLASEKIYCSRT